MSLSEERVQILVDYLGADADRAEKLGKMSAEDAAAAINAAGYDFTADELKEFGKATAKVKAANGSGELDEEVLENVAGGGWGAAIVMFLLSGIGIDWGRC